MQKNRIAIFLFVAIFALLGYFREFFFVNLNNILYQQYYHRPSGLPVPAIMKFFLRFNYDTLYYLKYPLTVMSTFIFFTANYFAVKTFIANAFFLKILMITYAGMMVLAALSMAYGYLVYNSLQHDEYTLSRWLMGIAQSPIICLILLASEKLYNTNRQ
jgi:hypothetical protein